MKKILALTLVFVMAMTVLAGCGKKDKYVFYSIGKDKETLDISIDKMKEGYSWKYAIEGTDKIRFVSEKQTDKKYIAVFKTVVKSGKGKKSGRAAVAFTLVNDKNPNEIARGYVVNLKMNSKGRMRVGKVDNYKMNPEISTTSDEE